MVREVAITGPTEVAELVSLSGYSVRQSLDRTEAITAPLPRFPRSARRVGRGGNR
jgi:hypothetical protein